MYKAQKTETPAQNAEPAGRTFNYYAHKSSLKQVPVHHGALAQPGTKSSGMHNPRSKDTRQSRYTGRSSSTFLLELRARMPAAPWGRSRLQATGVLTQPGDFQPRVDRDGIWYRRTG